MSRPTCFVWRRLFWRVTVVPIARVAVGGGRSATWRGAHLCSKKGVFGVSVDLNAQIQHFCAPVNVYPRQSAVRLGTLDVP